MDMNAILKNYNSTHKRRKGLGKEDMIHKAFAKVVESYKSINRLNCAWYSYIPSRKEFNIEKNDYKKYNCLCPHFVFRTIENNITKYTHIVFKGHKKKLSLAQILLSKACEESNEECFFAEDTIEATQFLKLLGIIEE